MLYAGVRAYGFNRLHILNRCWIWRRIGWDNWYEFVWQWFLQTQPHLPTSWSRSHCRHLRLSPDDVKCLHKLTKCCRRWCVYSHVYLGLDNCRNLQFGCHILHMSLTEVVGCVPPSWLLWSVKPHLLPPKTLHTVLYCFGDCAHHPARVIINTQLAKPCFFFIIFLVFPILLIVQTYKIAQSVSDCIQHLFKRFFGLAVCRSRIFSSTHIFLLLHNRCLCVLNSLFCHSGFPPHMILDPFLFLIIGWKVCFSSCLDPKLLVALQAAQCSQLSDTFFLQATLAFIGLMTSMCGLLCWFAEFAHWKWRKVLFGALTIGSCVDLVVWRDVGCCKIWTTWRQVESFRLRFIRLINSNKA